MTAFVGLRFWRCFHAIVAMCHVSIATEGQILPEHTFSVPLSLGAMARDWSLGGVAVPSNSGIVLSPAVSFRTGLIWSYKPLPTSNFEVNLKLVVRGPTPRQISDDGFVFWYVQENVSGTLEDLKKEYIHNQESIITNTWHQGMNKEGFNVFGHKDASTGLRVLFKDQLIGGQSQPSVSAQSTTGSSSTTHGQSAFAFDFRTGHDIEVKIRVQPKEATVSIVGANTLTIPGMFNPDGHIGLTCFSGRLPRRAEVPDFVLVKQLEVRSFDGTEIETKTSAPSVETVRGNEDKNLLDMTSSFKNHRDESSVLMELTTQVFKIITEEQPLRGQMVHALEMLSSRVDEVEKAFESLKSQIGKTVGRNLDAEWEEMKNDLTTLSRETSQEFETRHVKFANLEDDLDKVHENATSRESFDHHLNTLADTNQRVLNSVSNEQNKVAWIGVIVVLFTMVAGCSLYYKFRCWEKKHIL